MMRAKYDGVRVVHTFKMVLLSEDGRRLFHDFSACCSDERSSLLQKAVTFPQAPHKSAQEPWQHSVPSNGDCGFTGLSLATGCTVQNLRTPKDRCSRTRLLSILAFVVAHLRIRRAKQPKPQNQTTNHLLYLLQSGLLSLFALDEGQMLWNACSTLSLSLLILEPEEEDPSQSGSHRKMLKNA